MKVTFDYPLSDTAKWQGQLTVSATVDTQDAEIDRVLHVDPSGKISDITYLVEDYAPQLYDKLAEMAVNDARNLIHEDYTLENQ